MRRISTPVLFLFIIPIFCFLGVRPGTAAVEQFQRPLIETAIESLAAVRDDFQRQAPGLARIEAAHTTLKEALGDTMPEDLGRKLGLEEAALDAVSLSYRTISGLIDTTQAFLDGTRGDNREAILNTIDLAERALNEVQDGLKEKKEERGEFKRRLGGIIFDLIERNPKGKNHLLAARDELDPENIDRAIDDQKNVLSRLREVIAGLN